MSTSPDAWLDFVSTFSASIRSVGTACTLAAVGVYLHRRGFIIGDGKRTLALISQQVTIPLLFFTKIIYCNQDWSEDPCPDVTKSLRDVWVLLLWPIYVVGVGFAVGYVAAKLSKTPQSQIRAVLVACGFGNSTGLPITLLTVVHANFPATSDLGRIDPCLFLSVYLLLYPVLQWGVGGWLLAPENKPKKPKARHLRRLSTGIASNVLNRKMNDVHQWNHRGLGETDASMYMSVQENLHFYGRPQTMTRSGASTNGVDGTPPPSNADQEQVQTGMVKTESMNSIGMDLSRENSMILGSPSADHLSNMGLIREVLSDEDEMLPVASEQTTLLPLPKEEEADPTPPDSQSQSTSGSSAEEANLWETVSNISARCLQPPVIGALLGMLVASSPRLRGVFVDLVDRSDDAPLEWFFDGLYAVGQSAVPINMMILGCNLSASYNNNVKTDQEHLFSPQTTIAIVIGKMVVMPVIGFLSALFFRSYVWDIPEDIAGSFYLVVLIVFLTPTANNVMVMVELSGSGSKEGIARIIAWQYAVAPIILSLTMTAAVGIADQWS